MIPYKTIFEIAKRIEYPGILCVDDLIREGHGFEEAKISLEKLVERKLMGMFRDIFSEKEIKNVKF